MSRAHLLEIDGFNQLARVRDGYLLYNRHDAFVGRAIEKYGEYSALELQVVQQLCGPGDIVVDVGANMGAHTIALAQRVGPGGRVLAFEPQRLMFQILCANIALNSLANVDCHWAAVGRAAGAVTVPELDPGSLGNFGAVSVATDGPGTTVACTTLHRLVALPRLRLIKVDVEGMEEDVLAGGRETIARFKPFLYVENDRVERSEALLRLIDDLGYRCYWHLPPLFNPNNSFGDGEDIYPGLASINVLCVHRDVPARMTGFSEVTDPSFHPLRR